MTERLGPVTTEQQVRVLEVGEVFKPFEGLTELPPIPSDLKSQSVDLVTIPFQFKEAHGSITLNALAYDWANDLHGGPTPLGEARFVKSYKSGGEVAVNEAPLVIRLDPVLFTSVEQFRELLKHTLEFKLGDNRYFCGFYAEGETEDDIKRELELKGDYSLSSEFTSIGDQSGEAFLPCDLSVLRTIEVKILPLDQIES